MRIQLSSSISSTIASKCNGMLLGRGTGLQSSFSSLKFMNSSSYTMLNICCTLPVTNPLSLFPRIPFYLSNYLPRVLANPSQQHHCTPRLTFFLMTEKNKGMKLR
ncbi:hypothetical protein T01_12659 [Trichinella spiralis]|uniref:Uncharacterized protein n=1 Tax=Trichinella spiralis TaxID=6334 RepID=A0A0V1AVG3_TRISP|nr:hypothetical protein T01_12659 [Trichinella spiralis]